MKNIKLVSFLTAFVIFVVVHEGLHVVTSLAFNEFQGFVIHYFGFEVIFKTPVALREGFQWFVISGTSNIVTPILGWILLRNVPRFALKRNLSSAIVYWATIFLLIADPLNLFLGPFLYGGDAFGIAEGLNIPVYFVQIVAFLVLLINRELVAVKLIPEYNIETHHPLFIPWFMRTQSKETE